MMNTIYKISIGVLIVIALISTVGCGRRSSNEPPEQFDPPPSIFPSKVGKLEPEEKYKPKCIRDGAIKCAGAYADLAGDPDLTRIYYSVDLFDKPDQAVARLDELGRERVMDEDEFTSEQRPNNAGKLLIRSGFRRTEDGMTIGSCTFAFTKESKLFNITSSWERVGKGVSQRSDGYYRLIFLNSILKCFFFRFPSCSCDFLCVSGSSLSAFKL